MENSKYIAIGACKDRMLYRLESRNLSLGIYDLRTMGFVGLRLKFGERFLFTEFHYDTGEPHGTACPQEEIEELPGGIVLAENLGTVCGKCGQQLIWGLDEGSDTGKSRHGDGTEKCRDAWPTTIPNVKLYNWLAEKLGVATLPPPSGNAG